MNYPKYEIVSSSESDIFEFTSKGIKGEIEKIVQFEKTLFVGEQIYNLAFGDKRHRVEGNESITFIDDSIDSENGDRDKVLATVAAIVYEYTSLYIDRYIFFTGSDDRRTRLYRMAITKNYDELSNDFDIFGVVKKGEDFIRVPFNGKLDFLAYLVKRKVQINNL